MCCYPDKVGEVLCLVWPGSMSVYWPKGEGDACWEKRRWRKEEMFDRKDIKLQFTIDADIFTYSFVCLFLCLCVSVSVCVSVSFIPKILGQRAGGGGTSGILGKHSTTELYPE